MPCDRRPILSRPGVLPGLCSKVPKGWVEDAEDVNSAWRSAPLTDGQ
uniref:Uncharacterized protein n=1 Tax=Anguilla anguilla TaxID=7936 RepID=A0A0E9PKJ2_ANGAN